MATAHPVIPVDDLIDELGRPKAGAPLGALLSAHALTKGDETALVLGDASLSFAELDRMSNRLARMLQGRRVTAGDRVIISMPNRPEFIAAMYAAWKLGAVPCPVSYRLVAGEFAGMVALIEPACIVADATTQPGHADRLDVDAANWAAHDGSPLPQAVSMPGKIMPSGGSTGQPKLIIDPVPSVWGPDKASTFRPAGIVTLNAGPLYHTMPYNYCILPLAEGSTTVCMTHFDPREWLRLVERHRPHSVNLVPTMMSRIAKLPADITAAADLSSIEVLFHAAAPCPPDVKRWWIDRLGGERVLEVYGGTERIGATMIYGNEWLERPGSVGRAVSGDEIVILDDSGQELGPGQVGEIHFRRRALGPGTKYAYIGSDTRIRGDLDSFGDLGWLDEDGYLYIADRRSDMVIVGGMNVYPAEIEAAIERHPVVQCCAVIGLPDEDMGSRLHAIVELPPDQEVPADGLAFLAEELERLAAYKRPRSIEFTREPVRDDAGKVRRTQLRDLRLASPQTTHVI